MKFNEVFKKYDPKSEAAWYDYSGSRFMIAPMGNPLQKTELLKNFTLQETEELQVRGPAGLKAANAQEALSRLYGVYAKSVVCDWAELEDDAGKAMPFNAAKVHLLMVEHDDFAGWVIEQASKRREELDKEAEAVAKK